MDTPQAVQPATNAPGGVATLQVVVVPHVYRLPASMLVWDCINGTPCDVCAREYHDPIHKCQQDGCKHLTGSQKKFASDVCRARHFDALHPRINPPGLNLRAAGPIWKRYLGLMADGKWRNDRESADELQENESVVGRKRRWLTKRGHPFESRRLGGPQTPAQYRLLEPSAQAAA